MNIQNGYMAAVIALLGLYIAFSQWRVARAKFKLDLFEKRYAIYVATLDLLMRLAYSLPLDADRLLEHKERIEAVVFLFEDDVVEFVKKLNQMLITGEGGVPRAQAAKWAKEQLQMETPTRMFARYMTLRQWR
jgi:hypothetical protein